MKWNGLWRSPCRDNPSHFVASVQVSSAIFMLFSVWVKKLYMHMQLADSSCPISPLWSDNRGNFWGDNSGVCSHRIRMPGKKLNKGWEYRIWHVVWGYQASWFQRKGSYEKEYLPEDVKWDMYSTVLSSESQTNHYIEKLNWNLLIDI